MTDTSFYSSHDWDRLTATWQVTMYVDATEPGAREELPSTAYRSREIVNSRPFDEIMDEVLTRRADLWEKLADL